jgi:hypothetical protein
MLSFERNIPNFQSERFKILQWMGSKLNNQRLLTQVFNAYFFVGLLFIVMATDAIVKTEAGFAYS